MKILFITGINAFGGQEVFLLQLAKELNKHEYEVHVVIPPNQRIINLANNLGLEYYLLNFSSHYDINTLIYLIRLIRTKNYGIIHTHGTRGGYYGRLASRIARPKAKLVHHMYVPTHLITAGDSGEPGSLGKFRGKVYLLIERILAARTHKILTVSNHLMQYAIEYLGVTDSKIDIVYNTSIRSADILDRSSIDEINKSREEESFTMLFAGKFVYQKGLTFLIDSLARIKNKNDLDDFHLILCGDGALSEKLHQQIKESDLQDNVDFVGWQNTIDPYFRSCDCLVISSLWEGIPLVILEAMSYGRAVIATRVSGIPEAVIHRKNGLLVNPRDTDGFADSILECMNNRNLVYKMGIKGAYICSEKFTLEDSTNKVIEIYKSLVT